jgi:hypothetical protein
LTAEQKLAQYREVQGRVDENLRRCRGKDGVFQVLKKPGAG